MLNPSCATNLLRSPRCSKLHCSLILTVSLSSSMSCLTASMISKASTPGRESRSSDCTLVMPYPLAAFEASANISLIALMSAVGMASYARPRAFSNSLPVGSPSAISMAPPSGATVSAVMPIALIAALLITQQCPQVRVMTIGTSEDTVSRSQRSGILSASVK